MTSLFIPSKGMEAALIWLLLLLPPISFAMMFKHDAVFLNCLDKKSHPQNPTSRLAYTHQNTSFLSVFNALAWNARFQRLDYRKPSVIVTAMDESNVRATLLCCKEHGLQMRVRGGGHDMEGISYTASMPFAMLDMLKLRSIDINMKEETALVQAGAVLGELYYQIAQKSSEHAFPAGVCPTVGVTGHFSGGGYGNLMRTFGLSTDQVIDTLLMDFNGKVLDRKAMGEDHFWAIRGGGAASFGVILAWKVKLVRIPPIVTVFQVTRSLQEGASRTVYRWQEVAPNLPKTHFVRVRVSVIKDKVNGTGNKLKVDFVGMFLGRANELVDLLKNTFPELNLSPKECEEMPWVNSTLFWFGYPPGTPTQALISRTYERVSRKVKSDYVLKPIPQDVLEKLWKELLQMDGLVMEFNPYGGRMSEISENENAHHHRAGILYLIEYDFKWYETGLEVEMHHINLSRKLYEFMTPYVSNSPRKAFFNYRDLDLGTNYGMKAPSSLTAFGKNYYGDNFMKLVEVKTQVDPANFFANEQSIPPITLL